jgi:hypothetical protein
MPPKVNKKQAIEIQTPDKVVEKETTEIQNNVPQSELYKLIDLWSNITNEITSLEEKKAPLEKKRDEVISQIAKLRNKSSVAINIEPSVISLTSDSIVSESSIIDKPVKKTTKTKAKVEAIPDEVVEVVVKKPTKKTPAAKEPTVTKEVVKKAPSKTTTKVVAVKSKGKTVIEKLDEDSEENISKSVNKINDMSSSETDIESLSSCSSESECSGGEDD